MRKFSIFPLVHYFIYILGGVLIIALLSSLPVEPLPEGTLNESPLPIFALIGVFLCVYGFIGLVLKLLHMGTRFGLFGVLCIIHDGSGVSNWYSAFGILSLITGLPFSAGILLIPLALCLLSAILNLISLVRG